MLSLSFAFAFFCSLLFCFVFIRKYFNLQGPITPLWVVSLEVWPEKDWLSLSMHYLRDFKSVRLDLLAGSSTDGKLWARVFTALYVARVIADTDRLPDMTPSPSGTLHPVFIGETYYQWPFLFWHPHDDTKVIKFLGFRNFDE